MKLVRILFLGALIAVVLGSTGCFGAPPPQGFAGVTTDGDRLYVGTADGKILALDPSARIAQQAFPSEGEWSHAITKETRGTFGCGTSRTPSVLYSNPVLMDNQICIGTYDGKVLMMDMGSRESGLVFPQLRSGEWMFPRTESVIGPVVGSPAVAGDVVYVASSVKEGSRTLGVVYALDRLFGDELWVSEALDGKLWVTPAVVDGVVYVTTFDGRIYSLDAATGALLPWVFEAEFGFVSSPFIADGMVYVGSFDRKLNAVPVGSNGPAWTLQADNWFWSTPVVSDGVLYAGSLDGRLYAVDAQTGAPAWGTPYDAGEAIATSPLLVNDTVVVVTKKGDVHVVNRGMGMGARVPNPTNEKATTINAEVVATASVHDGLVYVRAQTNVLYAIDPVARTVVFMFSLATE